MPEQRRSKQGRKKNKRTLPKDLRVPAAQMRKIKGGIEPSKVRVPAAQMRKIKGGIEPSKVRQSTRKRIN
jgi:hypothetical protein